MEEHSSDDEKGEKQRSNSSVVALESLLSVGKRILDAVDIQPPTSVCPLPRPQQTPSGEPIFADRWGITTDQLRDYVTACRQRLEWNNADDVRTFVQKFVIPDTLGTGLGLALLLNKDAPKQVNLMISHTWDENAVLFFDDVLQRAMDDEVLFICFLALYQGAFARGAKVEARHEDDTWQLVTISDIKHDGNVSFIVTWTGDDGNLARREVDAEDVRRPRKMQWLVYQLKGFRNAVKHIFNDESEARTAFSGMARRHTRILVDPYGREVDSHVGMCNAALSHVREHLRGEWEVFEGDEPSLVQQLGDAVSNGPFTAVIESLLRNNGRMIVVTNGSCPLYTRLWCVWEIFCASLNGIPVDFVRRGRLFSSSLALRDASCSDKNDKIQIKDAIARKFVPILPTQKARLGKLAKEAVTRNVMAYLSPFTGNGVAWTTFGAYLNNMLKKDMQDGWGRLESVVRVVAQNADLSSADFALMRLDRAIYQSHDDVSGCSLCFEDVTDIANNLLQSNGAADFTRGRTLDEALDITSAAGVGELVVYAVGHEEIFFENNASGSLKKTTYDLRPFFHRAWSCEPACYKAVKAVYGSIRHSERCRDVTKVVNELIKKHGVRNLTDGKTLVDALDVDDPAIGEKKELTITVLACHTEIFRAQKCFGIDQTAFDLQIQGFLWHRSECGDLVERAVYQSIAHPHKQADVTDRVNMLCDENMLSDFTGGEILDKALGIDPAVGEAKVLLLTLRRPFSWVLRDQVQQEGVHQPVVFDLSRLFERTSLRHA
eukprot:TRINITY_DN17870_c0_g1_i2.p1 TRINITY_DN17870_c0_g1~~TRINITY_DN17870_c0_g1_i2.p1  ORF type:complete len:792 (+),score=109.44 TRINITY_DN17870_c0_g1_i2:57-2378(+)